MMQECTAVRSTAARAPAAREDEILRLSAEIRREALAGQVAPTVLDDRLDAMLLDRIERLTLDRTAQSDLSVAEKRRISENAFNAMRKLDILEPLIRDRSITEIMVNGTDAIFIERGGRIEETNLRFDSEDRLISLIMRIVTRVNRAVNESEPIVDARLEDGSRINAVLPPIALNGPVLTIRKFPASPMRLQSLISAGALTEEAAQTLEEFVRARYNLFVCGGTGSGKTTLLNALSGCIPSDERIITIEDSAELRLDSVRNLVRMETRTANAEGRGGIGMRELIRTSLRMRPERIIVGEVRGAEALDMLQAMNTGHDGSMSTGHANSAEDMLSRLETMVLSAAPLPLEAIRSQIASAIEVIVFLARHRDRTRVVVSIQEVVGMENGRIRLEPLYIWQDDDRGSGRLKRTGANLRRTEKLRRNGIACALSGDGAKESHAGAPSVDDAKATSAIAQAEKEGVK